VRNIAGIFLLGGEGEGKEEGRRQSDRKQIARTGFKPEKLKYFQAEPMQSVILFAADPDAREPGMPDFETQPSDWTCLGMHPGVEH
jgi:hypothetical protein